MMVCYWKEFQIASSVENHALCVIGEEDKDEVVASFTKHGTYWVMVISKFISGTNEELGITSVSVKGENRDPREIAEQMLIAAGGRMANEKEKLLL